MKLQNEQNKPVDIGNYNLGNLFYEFLIYYGFKFDPKENIVDPKGIYKNIDIFGRNYFAQHTDLIIIDPLNPFNNVAKSCSQFCNIKLIFIICFNSLQEGCECGCHYNQIGENYDNLNEVHCFLKRLFKCVQRYE